MFTNLVLHILQDIDNVTEQDKVGQWKAFNQLHIYQSCFAYFTSLWRHIPIVRYINFNLLEEALSMTLGLILALSFFGAFQKTSASTYAKHFKLPVAVTEQVQEINQTNP